MATRSTSTLTWQVSRTRMRVVHAGAQYALYFGLGLAVVSMLIGLNVFLAGETVALRAQVGDLDARADQVLWETAELVGEIAQQTSIYQIDVYAINQGYSEADRFLYVQPLPTGQPWKDLFELEPEESADEATLLTGEMSSSPAVDALLGRLIRWVETPPQTAGVALLR